MNYRRHPNDQEAHERVLNFLNHQACANQKHKEIPWEPTREGQNQNKNLTIPSSDEDAGELECSDMAGGSGNWHNYFGKLCGRICYL